MRPGFFFSLFPSAAFREGGAAVSEVSLLPRDEAGFDFSATLPSLIPHVEGNDGALRSQAPRWEQARAREGEGEARGGTASEREREEVDDDDRRVLPRRLLHAQCRLVFSSRSATLPPPSLDAIAIAEARSLRAFNPSARSALSERRRKVSGFGGQSTTKKKGGGKLTVPTSRSPDLDQATTEGVVRAPSALGTMTGLPPSMAATAELVVPKSMPTTCGEGKKREVFFGFVPGCRG